MREQSELNQRDMELLGQIEEILAGRYDGEQDTGSFQDFCAYLAGTVPRARDAFRKQLEARVVAAFEQRTQEAGKLIGSRGKPWPLAWLFPARPRWRAAVLGAVAAALMIGGGVAFYPPARALAQEAAEVVLELVTVTKTEVREVTVEVDKDAAPGTVAREVLDDGTIRQTVVKQITIDKDAQLAEVTTEVLDDGTVRITGVREVTVAVDKPDRASLKEIQAQVDFTVRLPAYLPEGYVLGDFVTYPDNRQRVTVWFFAPTHIAPGHPRIDFFELHEATRAQDIYGQGEVLQNVTVNGNDAVWTRPTVHEGGKPSSLIGHTLSWKEGELYYILLTLTDLPLNEMLKVAESLR